jgi:cytochrome c oxidase assembly protein subunit 19
MSSGGPNAQRFSPFTPPLRGSFPLDRTHICDSLVASYLKCLKDYNTHSHTTQIPETSPPAASSSNTCRELARKYLECRMDAGLMTEEDLKSLGY